MCALTPLEPQSRFGDKPVNFQVVCPQKKGTAVLQGLTVVRAYHLFETWSDLA